MKSQFVINHCNRVNYIFKKAEYVFEVTQVIKETNLIPLIDEVIRLERYQFKPYQGEVDEVAKNIEPTQDIQIGFEFFLYTKCNFASLYPKWISNNFQKYIIIMSLLKDISVVLKDTKLFDHLNHREILDRIDSVKDDSFYNDLTGLGGIKDIKEYLRLFWGLRLKNFISEEQFLKITHSNFTFKNIHVLLELPDQRLRNELWNYQFRRMLPLRPTTTCGNLTVVLNRELSHLSEHYPSPTSVNVLPKTYYESSITAAVEEFEYNLVKTTYPSFGFCESPTFTIKPIANALELLQLIGKGEKSEISEVEGNYFTLIIPSVITFNNTSVILISKPTHAPPLITHMDLNTHYAIVVGDIDPDTTQELSTELEKGHLIPPLALQLSRRNKNQDWQSGGLANMLGCIVRSVYKQDNDALYFEFDDRIVKMYHEQDCCESVEITDITGDLNDLVGYPLLKYEESTKEDYNKEEMDSNTWTFYKLASRKGYVDIRWLGSSNGYYSEAVNFETHYKALRPRLSLIESSEWTEVSDITVLEKQRVIRTYRGMLGDHDAFYVETDRYIYRFYGGEQFGNSVNLHKPIPDIPTDCLILTLTVDTTSIQTDDEPIYHTTFRFGTRNRYHELVWGGCFNDPTESSVYVTSYSKFK